jgi:hypothetical protein
MQNMVNAVLDKALHDSSGPIQRLSTLDLVVSACECTITTWYKGACRRCGSAIFMDIEPKVASLVLFCHFIWVVHFGSLLLSMPY